MKIDYKVTTIILSIIIVLWIVWGSFGYGMMGYGMHMMGNGQEMSNKK